MSKKKTYQFDLSIRLMAEADSVDQAFEAALAKLAPDFVQIRSEVTYQDVSPRTTARIDKDDEPERGVIVKEDIGIEELIKAEQGADPEKVREGLNRILDALMGPDLTIGLEPTPEVLLKDAMGEDN